MRERSHHRMIVVTDSEVSRAITAPFSPGRMCPARGPASTLGDRRPCFQEQVSDRSDALRGSAHGLTRTTPDSAGAPTVTIRDVARVAGVSYRTVSRVINGHGSASAKAPARTAAPAAERQAENRPLYHTPGARCRPASPPSYGLGRYAWDSSAPEVLTPLVARLSSMLVRASDYCSIYRIPVGRTGLSPAPQTTAESRTRRCVHASSCRGPRTRWRRGSCAPADSGSFLMHPHPVGRRSPGVLFLAEGLPAPM